MTQRATPLEDLIDRQNFVRRHIGPSPSDGSMDAMLETIGVESLADLIDRTVPASIRMTGDLAVGEGVSEVEVLEELRALAARNKTRRSLIGMGYVGTITPPVIRRNVLENPAWYTSYTPYQPEISQGRLEALLNFQTMVVDLTGLPVANASLLDEATAAAEALTLARRLSKSAVDRFFVHVDTHPQTIAVMATRAEPLDIEIVVGDIGDLRPEEVFGCLLSYPTSTGSISDWREVIESIRSAGGVAVVATDPLACVLLASPGSLGADIVIGSAQRFGVPMGFGGPHAAFMATREAYARSLPGRLVGVSTDSAGRPAYRLALQTREQHIRREKATSNICTAQALLANMAGFYVAWHGPDGLRRIAERVARLSAIAATLIERAGGSIRHSEFFDTVAFSMDPSSDETLSRLRAAGFSARRVDDTTVSLTFDECSTPDEVAAVVSAITGRDIDLNTVLSADDGSVRIPTDLRRNEAILTAAAFNSFHTEHEMLRYLRRLADKDLALDRTMIPLGSCTMKLNATTEMEPITWPEFADVHPYAPADESEGYRVLIEDIERMLVAITGYDAVSLQPNAGSQGELAGLLAIRAYHRGRGDADRNVCLIPSSAHGTNAASAVMAGMKVVVISCDDDGNIDLADLREKVAANEGAIAAAMVTYPSTHGVFEEKIGELCSIVHDAGGQVYVDGANLNALVGIAQPGRFGADVSHLNLHKTFCIPHGGGGPGVGPVAVRAHLAPYLPGHPLAPIGSQSVGPVSAAPHGSAGILRFRGSTSVSWARPDCAGRPKWRS